MCANFWQFGSCALFHQSQTLIANDFFYTQKSTKKFKIKLNDWRKPPSNLIDEKYVASQIKVDLSKKE